MLDKGKEKRYFEKIVYGQDELCKTGRFQEDNQEVEGQRSLCYKVQLLLQLVYTLKTDLRPELYTSVKLVIKIITICNLISYPCRCKGTQKHTNQRNL